MSAYVVSFNHINTLVSFLAQHCRQPRVTLNDGTVLIFNQTDDCQRAAEILLAENVRSVSYRYQDDDVSNLPGVIAEAGTAIVYNPIWYLPPAVAILKACDCYDYQTCENKDYPTTDAWKIVDTVRGYAIRSLRGYEEANWEIPCEPVRPMPARIF
jgi:hypothetical protein